MLSTPRRRLAAELARLSADLRAPAPRCVGWAATGDLAALRWLGTTLRRYHAVAVEPYAAAIRARAGQDRARRAEAALSGGAEGLLATPPSSRAGVGRARGSRRPIRSPGCCGSRAAP